MNEIYNLNLCDNTIKSMMELNPNLVNITDEEVIEKFNILQRVNCSNVEIRNIVSSNSMFLTKSVDDIIKLINVLEFYGFDCLNVLFDSNPFILNLDSFEVENYINGKVKDGCDLEDIVDDLSSDPLLFNEM